ncbi:MAG: SDR family oxidoreductase [Bacteroidetes bacterium]|nr:SDR family oxidoreductase [Bacteroidota bacterium]
MKKIFLLFGSTGDLGKAAVEFFLSQDYDFYYFFARKEFTIVGSKTNYKVVTASDLTNEESVEKSFSEIKKDNNAAYFLFSAVGGYFGGKNISETSFEDWLEMQNMNLNSAFLISKYFARLVNGTKGGSVCFTSAYSSLNPEKGKSAYIVSKNSLNYLVKSLALEGKEINLSANAVAPFIIDTPSNREWIDNPKKMVSPEEICSVVQSTFDNYKKVTGNIIQLP